MVHYKLHYFDVRGLGEMSRMVLHYAGQDFEDHRVSDEDWPDYKPKTPYGKMPFLEVDGKILTQSFAIARYLARKYGLAGKDDWESAQLDSIADLQKDFNIAISPYLEILLEEVPGDKDKAYKDIFLPAAEKHFKVLEKYLNESGSKFLGKSGPSWVDFFVVERINTLNGFIPEFLKKHPDLLAFKERVHNLPQLKNYIQTRKQTPE